MSRIAELLSELCPAGVEFKELGEIAELVRGNGMPKSDFVDDGVGCIHYGQIYTHYGTWATEVISYVPEEKAAKLAKVEPGDVIVTNTSENLEDVGKAVAWLGDETIVTGGHATVVKPSIDPKYLAYWFQSPAFYYEKKRRATGTKVIDVSAKHLAKVRIPVPPLEVQREIVEILDQFTRLEAELEAELEARRRQYEHYRARLMQVPAGLGASVSLDDMFEMRAGTHIKASDISETPTEERPYPCFGGNGIRGYVSEYSFDRSVLFIGRQGALCGNVHRSEGKIYATEHAVVVMPKMDVDLSWAFHKLTYMDLNQYQTKSAQPGLAVGRIKRLKIPYVPIDEQRRHGAMLDKFDALVNDISIGLPAEIAARRKQYQYYRDRLLTFEEAMA